MQRGTDELADRLVIGDAPDQAEVNSRRRSVDRIARQFTVCVGGVYQDQARPGIVDVGLEILGHDQSRVINLRNYINYCFGAVEIDDKHRTITKRNLQIIHSRLDSNALVVIERVEGCREAQREAFPDRSEDEAQLVGGIDPRTQRHIAGSVRYLERSHLRIKRQAGGYVVAFIAILDIKDQFVVARVVGYPQHRTVKQGGHILCGLKGRFGCLFALLLDRPGQEADDRGLVGLRDVRNVPESKVAAQRDPVIQHRCEMEPVHPLA